MTVVRIVRMLGCFGCGLAVLVGLECAGCGFQCGFQIEWGVFQLSRDLLLLRVRLRARLEDGLLIPSSAPNSF